MEDKASHEVDELKVFISHFIDLPCQHIRFQANVSNIKLQRRRHLNPAQHSINIINIPVKQIVHKIPV